MRPSAVLVGASGRFPWATLLLTTAFGSGGCAEGTLDPDRAGYHGGDAAPGGSGPGEGGARSVGFDGGAGATNGTSGSTSRDPITATTAEELFEASRIPSFEISLPRDRWEELQRNALDEQYVRANLSFEGKPVGVVGLRFKGYATLRMCVEGGEVVCDKLSMKVRFDQYDEQLRFYGLKRLCFNSMHFDPSMLHEKLAYDLYREMGVTAPRAGWATVVVNGTSHGLFSMVEAVDGRFTDDRWPGNGDGNLYKEVWPIFGGESYYDERLKTNEAQADHRAVLALHEQVVSATTPEEMHTVLGRWFDLESVYRYLAVDDAINAADGITTFYTAEDRSWTSNHNHYLYQEQQTDRFWLIPWDLDNSFWLLRASLVPHWSRTPEDCGKLYTAGESSGLRAAPGCDPVFQALGTDLTLYRRAIDELLEGPYSEQKVLGRVDELAALLDDAAREDPFVDIAEWADKVAEIKANIAVLRARLEAFRDGTPIEPLVLVRDQVNDFDGVTDLDAMLGGTAYTNAASNARMGTTEGDSGDGDEGLLLSFEHRDDAEPWSHYAVFYLPVDSGSHDVSGRGGIRFRARADRARSLRVELVSEAHTPLGNYIYEGWDTPLGPVWQNVELVFDAAALPRWATAEDVATQNPLEDVLRSLLSLRFYPECVGRGTSGLLGEGTVDEGFVELDDLEFFLPGS